MRIQEYRDMISAALQLVTDWSACVDDGERTLWRVRAIAGQAALAGATCSRASERDRERYTLALYKLQALLAVPELVAAKAVSVAAMRPASQSRASKYNKSPSRAVRISRAARSAMRRGYF